MREHFGKEYIRQEFDRLADTLSDNLTLYLIGGGAMAFQDLKDATKDIDVVVDGTADLDRLQDALTECGYTMVRDPAEEYENLGASAILENEDGCRFDIFNRQVVDALTFSEPMQDRCQPLDATAPLTVRIASPEDIFLFKAVAGRTGDIDDMNTLVQTGLDFDAIVEEIQTQSRLLGETLFITHVNEALLDLGERFNVTIPLQDDVEQLSAEVYDELAILMEIDDTATVDELRENTDVSDDRLDALLADLADRGKIERDDGTIRKVDDRP